MEILLGVAITAVLLVILLGISTTTGNVVKQAYAKLSAFSTARVAFDAMTQKLSQATLNTYLDYYGTGFGGIAERRTPTNASHFVPTCYGRASDLQFYVRPNVQGYNLQAVNVANPTVQALATTAAHGQEVYFQAPLAYSAAANYQGVQGLLNSCGYYVAYGDNNQFKPAAIASHRYRYRLMQAMEPTESFAVFVDLVENSGTGAVTDNAPKWMTNIQNVAPSGPPKGSAYVAPLAENVIAMIICPRLSVEEDPTGSALAPYYSYDSQYSVTPTLSSGKNPTYTQIPTADVLPPNVRVTMVVIDEASMIRLNGGVAAGTATPPAAIETALKGRFTNVTSFTTDMSNLITALSNAKPKITFQIFDATVPMRESKWSLAQH